jgi:uncharacterized protein YoxC
MYQQFRRNGTAGVKRSTLRMLSDDAAATLSGVFVSLVTTLFMYYVMSVEIKDEIKGIKDEMKGIKDEIKGIKDEMKKFKKDVNDRFDRLPGEFSKLFELKK